METTKKPSNKFSHEIRARAVRMVQEHPGECQQIVALFLQCRTHRTNAWRVQVLSMP
jgi:hypothetical protein